MKTTLTTSQAAQILVDDENANWTRAGAYALAEYLENLEEDTGEQIEFCRVSLRCDFSEYDSLLAFAEDYFADHKQAADDLGLNVSMTGDEFEETEEEVEETVREYIERKGTLIEFDGGIIISSF
jgi:hypothetical protein